MQIKTMIINAFVDGVVTKNKSILIKSYEYRFQVLPCSCKTQDTSIVLNRASTLSFESIYKSILAPTIMPIYILFNYWLHCKVICLEIE